MEKKILVGILMGSESDLRVMSQTGKILKEFEVPYEMKVASAHRSPLLVSKYAKEAEARGVKVIVCGAGMAAALAGVVASCTPLPVIGVPLAGSSLGGLDSLLSTAQMPAGIPVATVAIGKAGAKNAALLALEILALNDSLLLKKIKDYREKMARKIEKKKIKNL